MEKTLIFYWRVFPTRVLVKDSCHQIFTAKTRRRHDHNNTDKIPLYPEFFQDFGLAAYAKETLKRP